MSPLLLTAVLAVITVTAAALYVRRTAETPPQARGEHVPSRCALCAPARHPANRDARRHLTGIPRQTRGGAR